MSKGHIDPPDADIAASRPDRSGAAKRPPKEHRRRAAEGALVIQSYVATLPNAPGVYRMLDDDGEVLYVGKARNLKKRVANYVQIGKHPARLLRMIAETHGMEVVVTASEVEALLLEANLIKKLRPRYNILLRDDKSFPHILFTADHPFPQLVKHRGSHKRPGTYFGPFAAAGAVNRTINALQRAFMIRNCSDAVFSQRTRPCLQYQIKRCTAPCVGHVDAASYTDQVSEAVDFLSGKSQAVQQALADRMNRAAESLDFEAAARLRDRVRALSRIQAQQDINVDGVVDADAHAIFELAGQTCVQVYFFRGGRNYGTLAYFPRHDRSPSPADVLGAFIGQFYDSRPPPPLILVSEEPPESALLAAALSVRAGRRVALSRPQRGGKRRLIAHALANAREALGRKLSEGTAQSALLDQVAGLFELESSPTRIEVYDNSHLQGSAAIGAMIVAGPDGFQKNAYRTFSIKSASGNDDYGMMREVVGRRFTRAFREDPDRLSGQWPDLVLIDGGAGQLTAVTEILAEIGVTDVPLVAIAKGPDRNAGRERFFMPGREPFSLEPKDPVLYYLQRLRDEAHRFVIGGHRARRRRGLSRSPLDDVAGVGPARKKALLSRFGSGKAVARASLADLETVEGISKAMAQKIFDSLHRDG